MRGTVITLCGSTRFLQEFKSAHVQLTLLGVSTLTMAMASTGSDEAWTAGHKEMADLVYLQHIMRSDGVLVLGDGYVGWSVAREVTWASMLGVPVQPAMNQGFAEAVRLLRGRVTDLHIVATAHDRLMEGP